jgi:hypothetical protein
VIRADSIWVLSWSIAVGIDPRWEAARAIIYNPLLLGFGQGAVGNLLILTTAISPVGGNADFLKNWRRLIKTKASYAHFIR